MLALIIPNVSLQSKRQSLLKHLAPSADHRSSQDTAEAEERCSIAVSIIPSAISHPGICPDCGEILFRRKGKVPMIVCHNEKCSYKRKAEEGTEEINEEN